jgi:Flp pilus assembly protein TadD
VLDPGRGARCRAAPNSRPGCSRRSTTTSATDARLARLDVARFDEQFSSFCSVATDSGEDVRTRVAAVEWLGEIQARQPGFWLAAVHRARGLALLGRDDDALDVLFRALGERPGQADLLAEMAGLFMSRGNDKRALECIESALTTQPRDAGLHTARVHLLDRLGRPGAARRALERAVELLPDDEQLGELRRRHYRDDPGGDAG